MVNRHSGKPCHSRLSKMKLAPNRRNQRMDFRGCASLINTREKRGSKAKGSAGLVYSNNLRMKKNFVVRHKEGTGEEGKKTGGEEGGHPMFRKGGRQRS